MNSAGRLWVAAEWRRRWTALLGVAVLVALAGGVATALAAGARRADTAYMRFGEATGEPNLMAGVDLGGAKPTSAEETAELFSAHVEALDELTAIDGVESIEVETWWAISLYPELDPPGVVTAFAIGTFAWGGAPASPVVIDGHLPDLDDANAVTINEEAVDQLGLHVGSTLTFETAPPDRLFEWATNDGQLDSRDALDGPTIEVEVVAVTRTATDFEDPFPLIDFPDGFTRAHGDEIAHIEPLVYIRAAPGRLDEVAADVREVLAPYGLDVTTSPDSPGEAIVPSIDVGVSTLWIATAVAALGGLLLVGQALGRVVAGAATDHPTLAAIGLTHRQRTIASAAVAIVGIAAGALAVPLIAWTASGLFPRGAAALVEPRPGLHWDGNSLLSGAVLTFVAASGVLVLFAAGASRSRPAPSAGNSRLVGLLRGGPAVSLGASFATDPAGSGRRSRSIAGAAAASVAIAVAAVLVVATLDSSRANLRDSPGLYGAPAELMYESNGTFRIAEVLDLTLATPGVTAVTRNLIINDDTLTATGPAGPADVEPEAYDATLGGRLVPVAEGRSPQGTDEVALGAATAAALGAGVGDAVTIAPIGGGTPMPLTVSGIAVAWDTTDPEHAFVVQPETLRTLLCPDVELDECNVAVDIFASAGDEAARSALIDAGFVVVEPPANVTRLEQVGPIPWTLAGFLCLFAVTGLLHALFTALRRRRGDLAIARALGLGPRRAAAALTWQAVLTAATGALAGVLLGAIAGPAVWRLIAGGLGVIVVPRFPLLVAASVGVGAIVAAAAISIWPRWRAVELSAAEALRSE